MFFFYFCFSFTHGIVQFYTRMCFRNAVARLYILYYFFCFCQFCFFFFAVADAVNTNAKNLHFHTSLNVMRLLFLSTVFFSVFLSFISTHGCARMLMLMDIFHWTPHTLWLYFFLFDDYYFFFYHLLACNYCLCVIFVSAPSWSYLKKKIEWNLALVRFIFKKKKKPKNVVDSVSVCVKYC